MRALVELINGWIFQIALAPVIGSFLGVLIRRLPAGRGFAGGRSACEACGHALGPLELIPIASFAWQRGRCRHCAAPIAPMHLAVELASLLVPLTAATGIEAGAYAWPSCLLGWALLALAWIDAETMLLPDLLTLPLLGAGLAEALWLEPASLADRALAAALAYTALWGLAWGYRRLRGREGLGLGDAKLLAAGGAWLGTQTLPLALLSGALLALAWVGVMALRQGGLDGGRRIPFGPFLALGIWVGWVWLG